jgi:hypothetical protein
LALCCEHVGTQRGVVMSASEELSMEISRKVAATYREDVTWHLGEARENNDIEAARCHLEWARVWRVRAHYWARRGRGL